MSAHALLSASGAKRWMACTPSAVLEATFPPTSSKYADEGRLAHSLAELKLTKHFTVMKPSEYKKSLAMLTEDELYLPEMMDHVDAYVEYVKGAMLLAKNECPDAKIYFERRLDFSNYVPDGFGTGDVIIISDGMMEVIDLKYGKGVPVSAEENPQTRLYGAGALNEFWPLYDIERVKMTIHQPRLDSISSEELSVDDLTYWAESEVAPRAALAAAGEGAFTPGDHCRFCRAKAVCGARSELALATEDFKAKPLPALTPEDIAFILPRIKTLIAWAEDVQAYALELVASGAGKIPGYKLVEGRSNRVITDPPALAAKLLGAGYTQAQVYEPIKLLGLTALEKQIGKELTTIAGDLIKKPEGKPALVPTSDKRPELSSLEAAHRDFAQAAEIEE